MPEQLENNNNEETPVLSLLKQINNGELDPHTLTAEKRRQCVEALKVEGQSYASIANLLKKSEKTIKRDWDEVCRRNAEKPSPDYSLRLVAQMMMKSNSKEDFLTRLANSKDGSMQERAQSMYYASRILFESTQILQSMGYLPKQPSKITADVYQHQGDEIDTAKLKERIMSIEKILTEEGVNQALKDQLEDIKKKVELIDLDKQLKDLSEKVDESKQNKENDNE